MKHNGIKHLKNLAGRLREKSAFGRSDEVKTELDKRLADDND